MKTLMGPKQFVASCVLACSAFLSGAALASSPAEFIDEATVAGIAEIEASRMAISQTSSTDIESYAVEMIKDHTNANRDLKALASQQDWPILSDEQMQAKAQALMPALPEGEAFDAAYSTSQVKAREQAFELFKQQASRSESPELQALAEKYLPKFEMHRVMAQKLVDAHDRR